MFAHAITRNWTPSEVNIDQRGPTTAVSPLTALSKPLKIFLDFRLTRHPHEALLPRVWELRANMTAYDAVYVALAEVLNVPMVTCDGRLAHAPGHRAKVVLVW